MKSIFVTLLSGFMIYAGYIYHPIMHRIGNDISQRFQTEFVPVEKKQAPIHLSKARPAATMNKETADDSIDKQSNVAVNENAPETDSQNETVRQFPERTADDSWSTNRVRHTPSQSTHSRPKIPPVAKPTKKPPRFDLLGAIKRGLNVSDPSNFFISDNDRELGNSIQELEAHFDQLYANQHLTMKEIKKLKSDYQRSFNDLAEKYNLRAEQLTKFQEIIKRYN